MQELAPKMNDEYKLLWKGALLLSQYKFVRTRRRRCDFHFYDPSRANSRFPPSRCPLTLLALTSSSCTSSASPSVHPVDLWFRLPPSDAFKDFDKSISTRYYRRPAKVPTSWVLRSAKVSEWFVSANDAYNIWPGMPPKSAAPEVVSLFVREFCDDLFSAGKKVSIVGWGGGGEAEGIRQRAI